MSAEIRTYDEEFAFTKDMPIRAGYNRGNEGMRR